MYATGHGGVGVQAIQLDIGISIISDESAARNARTLYPWKRTSSSFEMVIKHRSIADYRAFNEWMVKYFQKMSQPDNTSVGPMRVIIPSRDFDRVCIPESAAEFGHSSAEFVREQALSFIGASDSIQPHNAGLGSLSEAYRSTYYTQGGTKGDYLSNYAVAQAGGAVLFGADFEDLLYSPKIRPDATLDGFRGRVR